MAGSLCTGARACQETPGPSSGIRPDPNSFIFIYFLRLLQCGARCGVLPAISPRRMVAVASFGPSASCS
eukprot:7785131-Pyramimonas_sp.AAC.1